MVRAMIITACLICTSAFGQKEIYVRPGLLTSSLTISPTMMLNRSESNYYLTGFLQGRIDKQISVRGETHYFIDGSADTPYLKFGSRTYFGILYHLSKGNFDSHIGLMPGLSVLQINGDLNVKGENPYHAVPSFAANIGITYYVWKVFNFFANVTYVKSSVHKLRSLNGKSDELMLSVGLGFNLNTTKAK